MDTPTLKCPRSGRVLTPLSMDYWRLKKKLNRILSDSSSADEERNETPLKRTAEPRKKNVGGKKEDTVSRHRVSPLDFAQPEEAPDELRADASITGVKPRHSRGTMRSPLSAVNKSSNDSDSDELVVLRVRRKAQKFTIRSSSSSSDEQENAEPERSTADVTENLSKALSSTRIDSPRPASPETRNEPRLVIHISSDEDDLPALDARIRKGSRETHLLKQSTRNNVSEVPVTEPKKRVKHEDDRGAMPPPTAPVKRTVNAKAKPQMKDDDDDLDFDELLENLRNRKHEDDDYDESQVDLDNTVCEWETSNLEHRKFLESLDEDKVPLKSCHKDALVYRKSKFGTIKDDLVKKLFKLYHETIFQGRFDSEIPITWNIRMLKTAGFCFYRRHADGSKAARIELSSKVIDRTSRLRDTLLHELCHAAGWLIHGYRDGHGTLFKFWGQRAFQLLGLTVTTTHSYKIETKYVYRCQGCANEVRRHSKSLDTSRFICSICKGRFELFVNSKRNNQVTPAKERKPSPFSIFVKDEYRGIKASTPHLKHSEIMSALSERWKAVKNSV